MEVRPWGACAHDQTEIERGNADEIREVLDGVVTGGRNEGLAQYSIRHLHERVAVRPGIRHQRCSHGACRTGAVFDHDRLAQFPGHRLGQGAKLHIRRRTRRESAQDRDRSIRKFLSPGDPRTRGGEDHRQKRNSKLAHGCFSSWLYAPLPASRLAASDPPHEFSPEGLVAHPASSRPRDST